MYAAYESLHSMFPKADIFTGREEPGSWDSVSLFGENQAVVIITPEFNADRYEMKNLVKFVENGNDVFLSTISLSSEAAAALNCDVNSLEHLISYFSMGDRDTLTVSLSYPPFADTSTYSYPGKQLDGYFSKIDTFTTTVLGTDKEGHADFVHLRAGKGNFYVHLAPMAFTNYFLLHKQNFDYYDQVFSLLSANKRKVLWDEYYITKRTDQTRNQSAKKGWLSTLLGIRNSAGDPSFAMAFWLLLLLLMLYIIMEMRRKQRPIPVVKKLQNDSLDFVKTIGRLYYDKGDHHNLCRKMAAYFLEHVRNRYKLATNKLDDEFINSLSNKSGISEMEIKNIVSFIRMLEQDYAISDVQLTTFHKQLESFYQKE